MLKVVINNKYKDKIEHFVQKLPECFLEEGETLENARNTIKIFDVNGLKVNVKSFKKPHIINQVIYATFRKSKANRSYLYAQKLEDKGIKTPAPLAYMETKCGLLLKDSAYISIHENFDGMLRELFYGTIEQHKDLIIAFAHFTAELHQKQILHLDYSSGNILYTKRDNKYTFMLVDLNRMKFDKEVTLNEACHNFRRLWGNNEMIKLFVTEYANIREFSQDECIEKTFKYRTRFWKYFNRKYPTAKPFINANEINI